MSIPNEHDPAQGGNSRSGAVVWAWRIAALAALALCWWFVQTATDEVANGISRALDKKPLRAEQNCAPGMRP
jgi:hypothetical protein